MNSNVAAQASGGAQPYMTRGHGAKPDAAGGITWVIHRQLRMRAWRWGFSSGAALILVSVTVLALANPLVHAVGEFERLWYWTVPIIVTFATHAGLFTYGRGAARGMLVVPAGGMVASGAASTLSMLAAGAQDLAGGLSPIGLAGAGAIVAQYQVLFLLVGLLSNIVGSVYILGVMHQHHLFPGRRSLPSAVAGWRVDRAVFPVAVVSAMAFVFVTIVTIIHRWWGW
jgi:hypothetical protein